MLIVTKTKQINNFQRLNRNNMPADVDNAFVIAFWFEDAALKNNEPLQPQKMQRLLFISQAYYAVINNGRKLMPAVFVANELGPIEPNVFVGAHSSKIKEL